MITVQIDLTKPGYADIGELLSAYAEGDTIMLENVEGRVSVAGPEFVEVQVEHLDLEDYMYDAPVSDNHVIDSAVPEGPDALA